MQIQHFVCKKPIDFHCHLRQEPLSLYLVRESAKYFSKVLAMPNTLPPILTPEDVTNYSKMLHRYAPAAIGAHYKKLDFLLTFKIVETTDPDSIPLLKKAGAIAGKLYPGGVTTNSEDGVKDFKSLYPVFDAMERNNLVLCVHAELPGSPIATAERDFLPVLQDILDNFPQLRIVFEHISTAAGVDFVINTKHKLLGATVTPHHLLLTKDDVFKNGEINNPHHFCKPVCKTAFDRNALRDVVFRKRHPSFFLGTDSAPHSHKNKLKTPPNAGVYNVSTSIHMLVDEFDKEEVLQHIEGFTSIFGERFYELEPDNSQIQFIRETWIAPEFENVEKVTGLKMQIKPLGAGQKMHWKISGQRFWDE